MLEIANIAVHFQTIFRLKGRVLTLSVINKELQFEIDTIPSDTLINFAGTFESPDLTVDYDFDDFKSLLRLAKKLDCSSISLSDDGSLCCGKGSDPVSSFFISPLNAGVRLDRSRQGQRNAGRFALG